MERYTSDEESYFLYKNFFLFGAFVSLVVAAVKFNDPLKLLDNAENIIGILFGVVSLVIYLWARNHFVKIKIDNESFEILNSKHKGFYKWEDLDNVDLTGNFVIFKLRNTASVLYSLTDKSDAKEVWRTMFTNRPIKTKIRELIREKKDGLSGKKNRA